MRTDISKQIFRCFIKILSPIHIGCDEVYDPTGFVVDEAARKLVVFNPIFFIGKLSDEERAKFSTICAKGTISSILEVYKFLRGKKSKGTLVDVCEDFVDHYQKTLSIPTGNETRIQQELNRFSIPRTAFSSLDQRPYIPGSSIKGALRTAHLNFMENKNKLSGSGKNYKSWELEQKLMDYSGISDDPFRMVKVSDFMPVGRVKTKIVYGVNEKKRMTDRPARGQALIFEVIQPGSVFTGLIRVEKPMKSALINRPISLDELLKSTEIFYRKEKLREDNELKAIGISPFKLRDEEMGVLLRCGRHSGAESVTINGHRSIKIMGKRGERSKSLNHATTFWLASNVRVPKIKTNLQPFGWLHLFELTDRLSKEFYEKEQAFKKELVFEQEVRLHEAERQLDLQRQAQEYEEQEAKKVEEKRIAEEKRKKELAAMSPDERDLAAFDTGQITEEQVNIFYKKLDEFSDENRVKFAERLKDYWVTQKKWTKTEVGKKQWKKVRERNKKIMEILGK
ncbi:MAG: CRISPR-associated protein Csm5 [Desulfobacteraceae bacterium Eth-SRB2]|nr:MAG: CRISPR-associated protein Csm5 [Desulfobacteraceae bacterium Eth-SRB2]